MSKKRRLIFRISIALNILLIVLVAWGLLKMGFVREQVLLTEVQNNLVELEGLIAKQSEDNWSQPNRVTTELGDVLNGLWLGLTTGEQLGTLSKSDKEILTKLYSKLNQYPTDELYSFVVISQEEKENFEELRKTLRNAGFGLNIQVSANMKYFMDQAEKLEKSLKVPLH
ncbi:hypothetical protein ACLM5H_25445 [Fredinandcohnia humi]